MELFLTTFVIIVIFITITFFFNKMQLHVRNYQGKLVPYSFGCVFIVLLMIDSFYFNLLRLNVAGVAFIGIVWALGFIDDKYGSPYPKGIKGHTKLFIEEGKVSTGLLKAVGIVITATVYTLISYQDDWLVALLLLILMPHTVNLLDTKPLRVWKVMILLFVLPTALFSLNYEMILLLFIVFIVWGIQEAFTKGMLGDNGAMLLGALWGIMTLQYYPIAIQIGILLFVCCITWLAEKISIQKWVEKTPVIRSIDILGRLE
ncbi:MAG: hypothetical protein LRY73_09720 [Bacillus sp. (in: Bacteria)]|nr:hypothetical protein [Bacillus sp. (in: firmicutes)]